MLDWGWLLAWYLTWDVLVVFSRLDEYIAFPLGDLVYTFSTGNVTNSLQVGPPCKSCFNLSWESMQMYDILWMFKDVQGGSHWNQSNSCEFLIGPSSHPDLADGCGYVDRCHSSTTKVAIDDAASWEWRGGLTTDGCHSGDQCVEFQNGMTVYGHYFSDCWYLHLGQYIQYIYIVQYIYIYT